MVIVEENTDIREQHDRLLVEKPSGVEHDTEACPICTESAKEGVMTDKTYSEDELKDAVAEAIASMQAEINTFKASKEAEAIDAKIDEALTPLRTQVAELQGSLDTATLRGDTAEKNYETLVSFLNDEAAKEIEAALVAVRREERIVAVKAVAAFSDEYIEKAIDRWSEMSDESFASLLEDWRAVPTAKVEGKTSLDLLGKTSMTAAREDKTDSMSEMRTLFQMNLTGNDIRTI